MTPITTVEYKAFQRAYDFFNRHLFADSLPHVLVTLQRHAGARGYFSPDRFTNRRAAEIRVHELAMNPDTFNGRDDRDICSTLTHEMVHVWQQVHGKPSSRGYHDKQWGSKMKEIGLHPSTTGEPGGKETGKKVTHYIVGGGPYDLAYSKLAATGFQLNWQSHGSEHARAKRESKTKFTCPTCEQNVWGKPDSNVICGVCYEDGDVVAMLAQA